MSDDISQGPTPWSLGGDPPEPQYMPNPPVPEERMEAFEPPKGAKRGDIGYRVNTTDGVRTEVVATPSGKPRTGDVPTEERGIVTVKAAPETAHDAPKVETETTTTTRTTKSK